jgi:hypothetical protein
LAHRVKEVVMKLRRPWVVGALSLIPFYWLFWYYAVNREMRDYGRARGDAGLAKVKPTVSVLAVTLGWFVIVPPLVSQWRTVLRIDASERVAGSRSGSTPLIVCLLGASFLVSWAGLIVAHVPTALALSFIGVVGTSAATVLMQQRLTRLWTAAGQPAVAHVG